MHQYILTARMCTWELQIHITLLNTGEFSRNTNHRRREVHPRDCISLSLYLGVELQKQGKNEDMRTP